MKYLNLLPAYPLLFIVDSIDSLSNFTRQQKHLMENIFVYLLWCDHKEQHKSELLREEREGGEEHSD